MNCKPFRRFCVPISLIFHTFPQRISSRNMASVTVGKKLYLVQFAQEHVDFRAPEIKALAKMLDVPVDPDQLTDLKGPFALINFKSDADAAKLIRRSVLAKSCYECWIHSDSYSELLEAVSRIEESHLEPYVVPGSSFRLRISSHARKLRWEEIQERIQDLLVFPLTLRCAVDLVNPTHSFHLLEQYEHSDPALPRKLYFGRWIADSTRTDADKYRLDQRYFIGTTSMDPLLALVMANQAAVEEGSLVYDPFVGTGSLLIAAAHFGAMVYGGDIDQTLLHGRGRSTRAKKTWRKKDESILANFRQYGLEKHYLDILVSDASRDVFRSDFQFDAIIADPPYGVREPLAQVSSTMEPGLPSRLRIGRCELNELIVVLLDFAAKHLRIGGRLVYFLPTLRDEYEDSVVPRHDCLEILSNSEQPLAGSTSRRLITMEKYRDWRPDYKVLHSKAYSTTFRDRYFNGSKEDTDENGISNNKQTNGTKSLPTAVFQSVTECQ